MRCNLRATNVILVAAMLLTNACAERAVPPPAPPPLSVGFSRDLPDVIEITMVDRQPVEQASLIGPGGKTIMAYRIDRDRLVVAGDSGIAPGLGLGILGGSSGGISSGFGIGFPFFGAPPASDTVMRSHALIRLDDMKAYRLDWPNWKLHLRLGSPETSERDVEFPAPRPPAQSLSLPQSISGMTSG
jgi:hypothetical protein